MFLCVCHNHVCDTILICIENDVHRLRTARFTSVAHVRILYSIVRSFPLSLARSSFSLSVSLSLSFSISRTVMGKAPQEKNGMYGSSPHARNNSGANATTLSVSLRSVSHYNIYCTVPGTSNRIQIFIISYLIRFAK